MCACNKKALRNINPPGTANIRSTTGTRNTNNFVPAVQQSPSGTSQKRLEVERKRRDALKKLS